MERNTPARKSHTNTTDLLIWPETPAPASSEPELAAARSRPRHQPSDKIAAVVFGAQGVELDDDADQALMRKTCSGPKLKEMTGSGIFSGDGENGEPQSGGASATPIKTGVRINQQGASAISQISFSVEGNTSPKKPTSLAEVAKQRELSGTIESDSESQSKKQISVAKFKEISGHDIFAPPPEIAPRPIAARYANSQEIEEPVQRSKHTSVKVSNPAGGPSNILFSDGGDDDALMKTAKKIHDQKFQDLSGNDIFKDNDGSLLAGSSEKSLSAAKLKEMSGSDIFADGKAASRDYLGGIRKPPGGGSSIALI